jgi:OOP family OmpA-OmpF porin
MVSGMLTAIRDFARDSFRVSEDESLDSFQVGDLTVWIEPGPQAVLAAVIRGTAPAELRETMKEAIEHVHARVGDALADFSGDTEPFEAVRPILETCLDARYRNETKNISPLLWVVPAVVVVGFAVWAYASLSARSRWTAYLDALRAEPGIVVVSTDRRDGKLIVNGLRDPLARDPSTLLGGSGLSTADVTGSWQLYQALEPAIVLTRARQLLRTPETVTLTLADGVLRADGAASVEWIGESLKLAPLVPGVVRLDPTPVIDAQVRSVEQEFSSSPPLFVRGSTVFEAGSQQRMAGHLERVRALEKLAQLSDRRYVIEVVGHADGDGTPGTNQSLSASRADLVRAAIESLGLSRIGVTATGVGSSLPISQQGSEADKRANRRVSLRIVPSK